MNQNEEQEGQQPIKISPVEFETDEQCREFIRKTSHGKSERKQSGNNNQFSNYKDNSNFNQLKTGQDLNYSEFLDDQYHTLALYLSQKLEEVKLYYVDMEIDDSNKQQLKNFVNQKHDVEGEREKDKPQDIIEENIIQIQTRSRKIIIKENDNQGSQRENLEIKIPQYIKEQNQKLSEQEQQQFITISIGQSSKNRGVQQQQSEQHEIIEQSSQSSSMQLTHNEKAERQERYDEIRDNEGRIKMQLKRFELIIFENSVPQSPIKNVKFEKDYQISMDIENRKYVIPKPNYPFIIYNQQIGEKDKSILLNSNCFVTSSIINAYSNYLQARDEHYYFSLNKNERIKHKRLFIFNSDFLTNCNLNEKPTNSIYKVFYLIMQYLQDFKVIQYQFWLIYKKIAFIVNANNLHWYLAVLDFQDGILKIYDSIPKSSTSYQALNSLLSQLFSKLSQQKITFSTVVCPTWARQQDGYSCGYHTCIALEYLSQYTAHNQCLTLEEIQKILRNLLRIEDNNQQ